MGNFRGHLENSLRILKAHREDILEYIFYLQNKLFSEWTQFLQELGPGALVSHYRQRYRQCEIHYDIIFFEISSGCPLIFPVGIMHRKEHNMKYKTLFDDTFFILLNEKTPPSRDIKLSRM